MRITVELTYDLAKVLGTRRIQLEEAGTVAEAIRQTRSRFGDQAEAYDRLTRVAALAVNGVLTRYQGGLDRPLADGDIVTFLKAAAGG